MLPDPARLVVVQHEDLVPLDLLAPALADADVRLVRPDRGEALPPLAEVDGVVVLGGTMTAYDDELAPWLPAVRGYLRDAVEHEVPTLAICLGAQLLAVALGGEVERSAPAGPERGVIEVRLRPDAETDPLLGEVLAALGRDVLVPSSHEDVVSALPAGAVWLASSRQYPFQSFRVGSAWGLQFHPEASADTLAAWTAHHDGDVETVRADHAAAADRLATLADVLGRTFARLAGERVAR